LTNLSVSFFQFAAVALRYICLFFSYSKYVAILATFPSEVGAPSPPISNEPNANFKAYCGSVTYLSVIPSNVS
jgi:hypothetical protein